MYDLSRRTLLRGIGAAALLPAVPGLAACGADGAVTVERQQPVLAPFVPGRRSVASTGLPERFAWANPYDVEFFNSLGRGADRAATQRGLGYLTAQASGDSAKDVSHLRTFLGRGVGAMLLQPTNMGAQAPIIRRAQADGVMVQVLVAAPSTLQIAAAQYRIGFEQGAAAARYVTDELGGEAKVAYFHNDSISQLKVRHHGVLAGLETGGGGLEVVSDEPTGKDDPSVLANVLQRHPDLDVVLGGDGTVVVCYRAAETLGKLRDRMYFGGVDGDRRALELIAAGTPYRRTEAFPWELMGYTLGQLAADWIEGLEVPRVLVARAHPLTDAKSIEEFEQVNRSPREVYGDPARLTAWLPLLGNVGVADKDHVWEQEYEPTAKEA